MTGPKAGTSAPSPATADAPVLAALLPMALHLHADGRIAVAGATIRKLIGDSAHFAAAFEAVRAGRAVAPCPDPPTEGRVFLRLKSCPAVTLRGDALRMDDGSTILNLGFGIGLARAVGRFDLTEQDFTGAELAMEMLFLHEANGAMLAEMSRSNLRLEEARRSAETDAFTDPLTGLLNRRGAEAAIGAAIRAARDGGNSGGRAQDHGQDFSENRGTDRRGDLVGYRGGGRPAVPFSVIQIDLDRFKAVNDSYGHAAGDDLLRATASKLRQITRAGDSAARMGGDEFLLVLPGLVERAALRRLGARIIQRIEEPVCLDAGTADISASLGIAVSTDCATPDMDQLLADADRALYRAKAAGRGRVEFADTEGVGSRAERLSDG